MYRTRQKAMGIEALEESLRITEENVSYGNKTIEIVSNNMSITPSVSKELTQTVVPKSIISDLEQFDKDQMKFKNW